MRNLICFLLVTVSLLSEITVYSPEEQKALDHYLTLWENPDFHIERHEDFVHKTVDRVILAVNDNPKYLDYWPHIAKAWSRFIGIKPTLIYIGKEKIPLAKDVGEVIRIPPVEGIPTAFQAQCVRLLAPALFPEEICVIADVDQFPFNAEFFHRPFDVLGEDSFIIYYSLFKEEKRAQRVQFVMSYNAAKGKIFGEIFGVKNIKDIRATLKYWHRQYFKRYRWFTDQTILFLYLSKWDKFDTHCYHLGREPLENAFTQHLLDVRKQLRPATDPNAKLSRVPQKKVVEDIWKGRYTEVYLKKGNPPFNQLMYEIFRLKE